MSLNIKKIIAPPLLQVQVAMFRSILHSASGLYFCKAELGGSFFQLLHGQVHCLLTFCVHVFSKKTDVLGRLQKTVI